MLPKQLKYGSKVESAAAKSSRVNIAPNNGTGPYNLGDTMIINIPTRQNLVLVPDQSYLKFTVLAMTSAADTTVRWDGSAHSIIQRICIYHGSNLIEDIDNYGLLAKMLFDIQVPSDACYGKLNLLAGTRNDLVVKLPAATAPSTAGVDTAAKIDTAINLALSTVAGATCSAFQINSGDILSNPTKKLTVETTYCLNLVSILGTLCSQNYFPLFACTSAPLRMEITLVDNILKAVNTNEDLTFGGAANIISNVEYVANFIELGDSAMSVVASSLNGQPLQMVVPGWRNYQFSYTLPAAQTQVTMAIPAKFSSLKSLFITIRDTAPTLAYYPLSSVTCNIIDYQFRIGASIFPPKAPSTLPEMFAEVIKAIGSMSDLNYQPSIEKYTYQLAASVANTMTLEANNASNVSSGSFYIGMDLENYVNANKDNIFAGWNSNTDDIFAIMNFKANAGAPNVRFDCFSNFDQCAVFENGTCYVRY